MEVRLQPWEEFDEPVDRIVSIGAFEHFGFNKYDDYFKKTFNWMPDDGVHDCYTRSSSPRTRRSRPRICR